jgi:competence protein ComEA
VPTLSRRLILALAVAGFFAALVAGRLHAASPVAAPGATTAGPASPPAVVSPPAASLLVHVVGAVRRAGVYRLRDGDRVLDAVRRAGGATGRADLGGVNLAARIADGQQVVVPARSRRRPATVGATAVPGAGTGPVSVNGATAADLDRLPGVGPATAARIIAWREAHGPFRAVDDLLDVPGIGPAKLAAMHDLLAL